MRGGGRGRNVLRGGGREGREGGEGGKGGGGRGGWVVGEPSLLAGQDGGLDHVTELANSLVDVLWRDREKKIESNSSFSIKFKQHLHKHVLIREFTTLFKEQVV